MRDRPFIRGLGDFLWRRGELVTFWGLALLHLLPVWQFQYVPTQDGPSHLFNAQVLIELGRSNPRYEEFWEVRVEPIPNWTSHVLLAGLLHVVPPLVAEKLLVSLYILGFAGAFRYFLGAFGPRAEPLAWFCLLFVYNRSLWMGFYNYCLSVIFVWLILGYCVRRRADFRVLQTALLTFLFAAAYFTHVVGFVVALIGALGAALVLRPWSLLRPIMVALAAAPWVFLLFDYFDQTRFFEAGAGSRLVEQPLALWQRGTWNVNIDGQMRALDGDLFGHHARQSDLMFFFVATCLAYVGFGVAAALWRLLRRLWPKDPDAMEYAHVALSEPPPPSWFFPFSMGLLMLACFMLLSDHLGFGGRNLPHGGFVKCRLAILPSLFALACLREPAQWPIRWALRGGAVLIVIANLSGVTETFERDNRLLAQYTAGIEAAGRGHKLLANEAGGGTRFANPMRHADDYYCLGTDNINIDNYEADTMHFPIKLRSGVRRGRSTDADLRLFWNVFPSVRGPEWTNVFDRPPMQIFLRREGGQ
jgi:hypothetical protein